MSSTLPPSEYFRRWLGQTPPPWRIGQVVILPSAGGGFELRHEADADAAPDALECLNDWEAARVLARFDAQGAYRPLKAAANLRARWRIGPLDFPQLQEQLEALYPAAVPEWALWRQGAVQATPFAQTAARQTGRYRVLRELSPEQLQANVAQCCEKSCGKLRLWPPAQEAQAPAADPARIPLYCVEACNYFTEHARARMRP